MKRRASSIERSGGRAAGLAPLLAAVLACLLAAGFAPAALGAEPGTYPLVFTDDLGRRVEVREAPARIVSIGPSNTEILFALGAGDRVVGVDSYSDYPPEAAGLPHVGSLLSPAYDAILALEPDVVLVATVPRDHIDRLAALGLTVVVLAASNLDEVYASIERVGAIVDRRAEAAELVRNLRTRQERVAEAVASIPAAERPRVFYELWHDPIQSAGPGTFIHELIELAGGTNVAADAPAPWPQFSLEALVARDPQVIVTSAQASYDELRRGARRQWEGISAVRDGRIHFIDADILTRPGPRIIDGLEAMAYALHPDRFRRE